MPCTPTAERASRTSSSLNGLMIAMISFMSSPFPLDRKSERHADRADNAGLAGILAGRRDEGPVGVDILNAEGERLPCQGRAQVPVGIAVADRQPARAERVAEMGGKGEGRLRNGRAEVAGKIDIVVLRRADLIERQRLLLRRVIDRRLGGYRAQCLGDVELGLGEV